ncbi:MAG: hypothetical protein M1818_008421 [Claussenomyces sp. TS43310]|nr:MAG: hypothetical protein M1818_008421 [Claussenomyces sp. TS43310]
MRLFTRTARKGYKSSNTDDASAPDVPTGAALKFPGFTTTDMSTRSSTSASTTFSPTVGAPRSAMLKRPDPSLDPIAYLGSIGAVRERCNLVLEKAKSNELNHFVVDMTKFQDTTKFVSSIIKRDFAPDYNSIPPHGLWQQFLAGGKDRIAYLLQSWSSDVDASERTRRLLDLFLVSVMLDADAGISWSYRSKEDGKIYERGEGLAVASLEMFKAGMFSSNCSQPHQVDGEGLRRLTVDSVGDALQVSQQNPMPGLEGQANLLKRLSGALRNQDLFGADARPGNMLGAEILTGLPDHRNGGLFIDTGVLTLKPEETGRGIEKFKMVSDQQLGRHVEVVPTFEESDDVVVEWRAVTVGLLDELLAEINKDLGLRGSNELSMTQMLEGGSWKGGKEIAEVSRPNTKEPPIITLRGVVF